MYRFRYRQTKTNAERRVVVKCNITCLTIQPETLFFCFTRVLITLRRIRYARKS